MQEITHGDEIAYAGASFTTARATFQHLKAKKTNKQVFWRINGKIHKEYRGLRNKDELQKIRNRSKVTKHDEILRLARKLAIEEVNKNRAEHNPPLKPITRVEPGWWQSYGDEWVNKAKEQLHGTTKTE